MKSRGNLGAATVLGLVLAMAAGVVIGALVYSWVGGAEAPGPHQDEPAAGAAHDDEHLRIGAEAQASAGITMGEASLRPMASGIQATGVVNPDLTRVARLRPIARGLVKKVLVDPGDRVRANQPVVSYDNIDLGLAIGEYLNAKAELERRQTGLEVKRQILARSEEMLKVGAVARTTHDIREAEFKEAGAAVRSAGAIVSQVDEQLHRFGLDKAAVQRLDEQERPDFHRDASLSVLRAPIGGIVTGYNVAEGETVSPSDVLLTITDISSVWVLADVYEKDLARIRTGQSVRVRIAAYPDERFTGRITYVSDVLDPRTRTAKVRCVVANPEGRLRLEMFANIEIPTVASAETLAVPTVALQRVGGETVVFLRRSETGFEARVVATGIEDDGWTQVLSGLDPGDPIVAGGSFYLKTEALRDLVISDHGH